MKDMKEAWGEISKSKRYCYLGEPEVLGSGQVASDDGKHASFAVVRMGGGTRSIAKALISKGSIFM